MHEENKVSTKSVLKCFFKLKIHILITDSQVWTQLTHFVFLKFIVLYLELP